MNSRLEKYSSNATNISRTDKNRKLYEDLYKNTSYSNSVILDDSKEIDIAKIKEIIDSEKQEESQKKSIKSSKDLYKELRELEEEEKEDKVYDINEVLKNAKNKRDIIEDANEKRKIRNDKYSSHLNIEEELAKTRKIYDKLLKEETELLDIMNTLTNVTKTNLEEDMFKDLTATQDFKEKTIEVTQIGEDEPSKEYSTNTFMFDEKDFDNGEDAKLVIEKSRKIKKLLVFVITFLVVLAGAYVIYKYVLK